MSSSHDDANWGNLRYHRACFFEDVESGAKNDGPFFWSIVVWLFIQNRHSNWILVVSFLNISFYAYVVFFNISIEEDHIVNGTRLSRSLVLRWNHWKKKHRSTRAIEEHQKCTAGLIKHVAFGIPVALSNMQDLCYKTCTQSVSYCLVPVVS